MSYNSDLFTLDRASSTSLTGQLVERVAEAIDAGELAPGAKLPTTRALAADAQINHLTAARAYRRLAELGYVTAQVGRGTFVREMPPGAVDERGDDWQLLALPEHPRSYEEEVLADAFRMAQEPGMVSLATGWPAPRSFPAEELAALTARVFAEEGPEVLSYSTAEGVPALREELARRGRLVGFASDADEILVTSGARQALDLVARTVLRPGDVAVVESPSFAGLLSALRATGARVIGVPVDAQGFDTDMLEQVLARHEVKLCALQPASQNPTGGDLAPARREALASLAQERNFFVLEDAVYADQRFEGERGMPIRAAAPSHVIYVDSLSKAIGGGLRIGWLAARGPIFGRLASLKMETDFQTATLVQHVAARYLASGGYERQLERTQPFYRERRDALMAALERHLAGEYRAERPRGGHHVWVTLNRPIDERSLYSEALRHGVSFTPGGSVSAFKTTQTSLRLSFPLVDPEELDEGVRRLARAIREVRRRERHRTTMPVS